MRVAVIFILSLVPFVAFGQEESLDKLTDRQKNNIIEVVSTWISEMFKAESVDVLMRISEVPFALDRVKVLTNTDELKEVYLSIFENKGQREKPKYQVQLLSYKSEILESCIPVNVVKVRVWLYDEEGDEEGVLVAVLLKQDEYKIAGFSD